MSNRNPAPDPCPHCGKRHTRLTDQQANELRDKLFAMFAALGGSASFQTEAYNAWVETLPFRFDYSEVTGPDWYLAQCQRDVERFVRIYGALKSRPAPGSHEPVQ